MQKTSSRWSPSKYVHLFHQGSLYAVYHTLNKALLFVGRNDYHSIQKILRRKLRLTNQDIRQDRKLRALYDNGFLTKDHKAELRQAQEILKKQQPQEIRLSSMYLVVTTDCNFRCRYCFVTHNVDQRSIETMDWGTMRRGIDLFACRCDKAGIKTIVFYGGEPLLAAELVKRGIRYIRQRQRRGSFGRGEVRIGINTNGSLLNDELLNFLKKYRCAPGISLDGPRAVNDRARVRLSGQGTFNQVARAIDNLNRKRMPYIISVTLGQHNVRQLEHNLDRLIKRFHLARLGFNFIFDYFCSRNPYAVPAKILLPALRRFYAALGKKALSEDHFKRRLDAFFDPFRPYIYCNAYGRQLVVLPDKSIGPCHAFAGTAKFFIPDNGSRTLWKNKLWNKWARRSIVGNDRCKKCKYILLCGGGCAYKAYTASQDINQPDRLNCHLTKLFVDQYIMFSHLFLDQIAYEQK